VEALIETGSLRQAAARLHRSYNTLRAQLRSILQKTGTKSQVELIRLLHRG
jgi:DNA-binding CsgD family transcriptional regulator